MINQTSTPLQRIHNGCFLVDEATAKNSMMQSVMESYLAQVNREAAHTKAIREGRIPAPQGEYGTWDISDRD